MAKVSVSTVIKQNPKVVYKKVEDKIIILDDKKAKLRELNEVASLIWTLAKKWTSIGDITTHIRERYNVERQEITRDVKEFVAEYLDNNLFLKRG